MARGPIGIPGPSIFVVPNDLATVRQPHVTQMDVDVRRKVVNAIDEQVSGWTQEPSRLRDPLLRPLEPPIAVAVTERNTKFLVNL